MAKNSVRDWDTTSTANTDVGGTGINEGCDPGNINDAIRKVMAQTAEWFGDTNGSLVSGGSASAYTLTTNEGVTAYAQGMVFMFEANHASTGASTLAVDGLAAKAIKKRNDVALAAGDIESGQIVLVAYEAAADAFQMLSQVAATTDLVNDITPQLGGDLDLNGNAIDFPSTANISDVLDEDNMASNSATALATQQSIKAYADTKNVTYDSTNSTSASGTAINFDIPADAKRVTITFAALSTSGTSVPIFQLSDSGGFETSGYVTTGSALGASSVGSGSNTDGFSWAYTGQWSAAIVVEGAVVFTLHDAATNTWICHGFATRGASVVTYYFVGSKALSGALTDIRLTTSGGSDTFDAGTVNFSYEV